MVASQAPASAQENLTLITENNPPFTYPDPQTGQAVGPAVDIVKMLMDHAGISYSMQILPWRRAYRVAQVSTDTCLFLTYRTAEREALFKWVGPIVEGDWAIYKRKGSSITISTLDELKQYTVTGMYSSAHVLALEAETGIDVLETGSDELSAQMLYRGRADLWITDVLDGRVAAEAMKLPEPELVKLWRSSDMSLACSQQTAQPLIDKLSQANRDIEDIKEAVLAGMSRPGANSDTPN